ncbi:hypothetical protein JW835_05825 [bacterium]|nr:hypothetical protein [bacterium]
MKPRHLWTIPYIDQPPEFWQDLNTHCGEWIDEVYLPMPSDIVSSGRPLQPEVHVMDFLKHSPFKISVLLNPVIFSRPLHEISGQITAQLKTMVSEYRIHSVSVSNITLAEMIKKNIPQLVLNASVLLDIWSPAQLEYINDVFDILVPSSRIVRNMPALKAMKKGFKGQIKLIVNEGCLPHCVYRNQHFYEMGSGIDNPRSLCRELIDKKPWLRLTGSWILPQHLYLYNGVCDTFKLSGRVTLQNPDYYKEVLTAYIKRQARRPHRIGGGPVCGSLNMHIDDAFFKKTLYCNKDCQSCVLCREKYRANQTD